MIDYVKKAIVMTRSKLSQTAKLIKNNSESVIMQEKLNYGDFIKLFICHFFFIFIVQFNFVIWLYRFPFPLLGSPLFMPGCTIILSIFLSLTLFLITNQFKKAKIIKYYYFAIFLLVIIIVVFVGITIKFPIIKNAME